MDSDEKRKDNIFSLTKASETYAQKIKLLTKKQRLSLISEMMNSPIAKDDREEIKEET
jgi:hypothetical protein